MPGYGRADPDTIREIRRLAIKAECLGQFNTPLHKVISHTFFLRRLPIVFLPDRANVHLAKKLSGKNVFRQIIERLILLLLFRNEPNSYYRFAFFMPDRYRRAGEYIDYRQQSFLNFLLNQSKSAIVTEDKVLLHDLCVQNGLPSPTILGILNPREAVSKELASQLEKAAQGGGVFFKPRFGSNAECVGFLIVEDVGQWSVKMGREERSCICWEQVFEMLSAVNEPLIFQKKLTNHPILAKINPNVLHTIRLVTFRDGDEIHTLEAILRLGRKGSIADNISSGGIGIPIDLITGILGKGNSMNTGDLPLSIQSLEPGGRKFVGMTVPFLDEAIAMGKKVHASIPEIFSLGHDIAILPNGPVIIETNHIWGENQDTFDRGIGSYRLFSERLQQIAIRKIGCENY